VGATEIEEEEEEEEEEDYDDDGDGDDWWRKRPWPDHLATLLPELIISCRFQHWVVLQLCDWLTANIPSS
jgi:hypothetical protein